MLPVASLLFNVISGLVVDKATDLATEHVESMIDDLLPESAKKELDKAVKDDPSHQFTNAKDALMAEVYKDSWFARPENHKKRDELIKKIATDQNICKYFY